MVQSGQRSRVAQRLMCSKTYPNLSPIAPLLPGTAGAPSWPLLREAENVIGRARLYQARTHMDLIKSVGLGLEKFQPASGHTPTSGGRSQSTIFPSSPKSWCKLLNRNRIHGSVINDNITNLLASCLNETNDHSHCLKLYSDPFSSLPISYTSPALPSLSSPKSQLLPPTMSPVEVQRLPLPTVMRDKPVNQS